MVEDIVQEPYHMKDSIRTIRKDMIEEEVVYQMTIGRSKIVSLCGIYYWNESTNCVFLILPPT